MTYLSPVAEREGVQILSYNKWEQAFRIYSNVLTAKYPTKSTELLQYSHTIHSSAAIYSWDNVYDYDKAFRRHISRHPTRSWSVILQQAWTMILKDRISTGGNTLFSKGNGKKKSGEPCRRYNKGRCNFRLSCKFDHHCSVKKCG